MKMISSEVLSKEFRRLLRAIFPTGNGWGRISRVQMTGHVFNPLVPPARFH